ncbi:MAG TPA: sensor histidine kinase [Saprospiraceae bacterium]|nr:sensor histidine kinase [Saprospiraceae bacterium]
MKKSFIVLIHLGFWACYFLLVFIVLAVYSRSGTEVSNAEGRVMTAFYSILLFAFIPSVISYFLYYFFLFPRYLQQKRIISAILVGLFISVVASILAYILHRYFIETGQLADMDEGGIHGRSTAPRTLMVMTFIGTLCGMVALVIKGFITWFNEIKLKEALTEKTHQMEMALIKSQLDPHLLFNTINNIDALILKDSVVASEYLNKLSDIMRFILYETKGDTISLAREIEYIDKYIALQKIRTANENYVHFEVTGKPGNKMIAPMVFIPFIENAFKHTTNKKLENAIMVHIFINEETTRLVCENKFDPNANVQHDIGGLGNELIRKRLNLLYPGQHQLDVHKTDDRYSINLTIPNG